MLGSLLLGVRLLGLLWLLGLLEPWLSGLL